MNTNGFINRFYESNIPNTEPPQNPLKAGALTFKTPKTEFSGVIFVKPYPFVVQKCPVAYLFTIFYILGKQDFIFSTYFNILKVLITVRRVTPTSANIACHIVAIPNVLSNNANIFIVNANIKFCFIILFVFLEISIALQILSKLSVIRTKLVYFY